LIEVTVQTEVHGVEILVPRPLPELCQSFAMALCLVDTMKEISRVAKTKLRRGKIMKSSARDKAEGKIHQAKGKIKEAVGELVGDRDLKVEGKDENLGGKVQEKVGHVKKVLGK
jgi:uncharacterized protein YjbJ (UPF0337 family)